MLSLAYHLAPDEIAFLPVADHQRGSCAAEGTQGGHQVNRFQDVRLTLGIPAQQQMEARRKIDIKIGNGQRAQASQGSKLSVGVRRSHAIPESER